MNIVFYFILLSLLLVLFLSTLMVCGALYQNAPPWNDAPGFKQRLKIYISTKNVATHPEHQFAELRSRTYAIDDDELLRISRDVIAKLGLDITSASRVGRGDLAANTRHVMNIYEAVDHYMESVLP